MHTKLGWDGLVDAGQKRRNSMARCRPVSSVITLPEATSKAAYRLVVPWRV